MAPVSQELEPPANPGRFRTDAFLKERYCKVESVVGMPKPIDAAVTGGTKLAYGTMIGESANSDFFDHYFAVPLMGEADANYIFIGFVRYDDNLGINYTSGFRFIYDATTNCFSLFGTDEYNYRKKD